MIFDYSLAAVVAAGCCVICSTPCCDLNDFSAEIACPWIWFRQAFQHGSFQPSISAASIEAGLKL